MNRQSIIVEAVVVSGRLVGLLVWVDVSSRHLIRADLLGRQEDMSSYWGCGIVSTSMKGEISI